MDISLFIIDYHHKNSNGLTEYVAQLIDELQSYRLLNINVIGVNAKIDSIVEKINIEGINHYLYSRELHSNNINNHELINLLKQEIDVEYPVIFHFNWINHAPFAQILKKNFDCITVLTKHCIPWRDNVTNNYELFTSLNNIFLSDSSFDTIFPMLHREYISYTSVDHIICVTDFAKSSLIKMFGLHDEKLTVVHNGLKFMDAQVKKKDDLKIDYGFPISDKIILFAGSVNIRKGIIDLVESFKLLLKKLPNSRLVIAGKGDFEAVFSAADSIWSRITVTGNLDKKTLFNFYRMADVGVVPSYIEQCSYTVIEMMHAGLPIVVTDVDGLSEIVPVDGGIKVPLLLEEDKARLDKTKLSSAIYSLLADSNCKSSAKSGQLKL